jgi:TRAP-type C4-dicarboxylate transport system permease small subunit
MNKKYTSTVLLFAVFIGFLWWGVAMLQGSLTAKPVDGESVIYSILILACAGTALVAILKLPRKRQS